MYNIRISNKHLGVVLGLLSYGEEMASEKQARKKYHNVMIAIEKQVFA